MMEYSVRVVYCTENDLEVFTSVYVIRYTAWLVGLLCGRTCSLQQLRWMSNKNKKETNSS